MEKLEEAKIGGVAGFIAGVFLISQTAMLFGTGMGLVCGAVVYFRNEIWKMWQDYKKKAKEAKKK